MRLILVVLLTLVAVDVFGACEEYPASSGEWYPGSYASQSLSESDVFSCDDQVGWSAGDTINLKAGSATWTSRNIVDYSVTFQGAGSGSTVITLSRTDFYGVLDLDSSSSATIEFYDFKIITSGTIWNGFIRTQGDNTGNIIFGNMYFDKEGSQYVVSMDNRANVLIYNSTFDCINGTASSQPLFVHSSTPVESMKKSIGYGQGPSTTIEWAVVEGCTFYMPCAPTQYDGSTKSALFDMQKSGKIRFRNNTVVNGYFLNHGSCWTAAGSNGIGGYAIEAYDNHFIADDGCYPPMFTEIMSGTMIFHDNNVEERGTGHYQTSYDLCSDPNVLCANHWMDTRTLQADRCWSDASWVGLNGNFDTAYLDSGSTDSNWYTCDSTHVRNGYSCTKKFCSNSWEVCTSDGDCSDGGTCDRSPDGTTKFNQTGAGAMVDAGATAYVEAAPVYYWDNNYLECDSNGENCTDHGDGSVQAADSSPSSTLILNTYLFNDTALPSYTEAAYPDARIGGIVCYPDVDNDLYPGAGSEVVESTCSTNYYVVSHFTALIEDCDDTNSSINPGETDICGNGIDEDCSGSDASCGGGGGGGGGALISNGTAIYVNSSGEAYALPE